MKVNLKVKKDDNTVETRQHEVEELNIFQVTRAIKVIKDVIDVVQKDDSLQMLIFEMFEDAQEDVKNIEDGQEEDSQENEVTDSTGQRIARHLAGAMDVLLVEVPDKAIELLSVLSNIEHDIFVQQKAEDLFDIYDAIIQVNDIEKLINRAKKSLALTKSQVKVMSISQSKKDQEVLKQA